MGRNNRGATGTTSPRAEPAGRPLPESPPLSPPLPAMFRDHSAHLPWRAVGALHPNTLDPKGKAQFGALLGFTMMGIPPALRKCGVSEQQELMILDSLSSMGKGMSMKFRMPKGHMGKREVGTIFNATITDWSAFRWFDFGQGLGLVCLGSDLGGDGRGRRRSAGVARTCVYVVWCNGLSCHAI